MSKRLLRTAAFCLAMAAGGAQAAITADDIVAQYQSAGYDRIEVKVGATQARVEAIKDGMKIEVVYDLASGAILQSESGAVKPGEDVTPGVEVEAADGDLLDDDGHHSGSGSGDDASDDDGSGHDAGDDNGDDNGGGSDDGAGHDSGDDHGGSGGGHGSDDGDDD